MAEVLAGFGYPGKGKTVIRYHALVIRDSEDSAIRRKMNIPLLAEEGWTRHQQNIAKHPFIGADGVVRSAKYIGSELTTPSARNKVASRLLIDRASTPPLRGGECAH